MNKDTILRSLKTLCPECRCTLDGHIILKNGAALLSRHCPVHGVTDQVLSYNPRFYADLDRYYIDVLKRGVGSGRITNYWILSTSECQMKCSFCHANVQNPVFFRFLFA